MHECKTTLIIKDAVLIMHINKHNRYVHVRIYIKLPQAMCSAYPTKVKKKKEQ